MLSRMMDDYIALRHASGFKCVDVEKQLRSYIRFTHEQGHSDEHLCAAMVIEWAKLGRSPRTRYRRFRTISMFADYLRVEDERHDPMPLDAFPAVHSQRCPPRIFSPVEMARVLSVTDTLVPVISIRPLMYRTLFGLLFATGMRISEALHLRLEDVQPDGLMIHKTKFGKSRQLPMHPSTAAELEKYLLIRRNLPAESDQLFLSWRWYRPMGVATVRRTFQVLCDRAGIHGSGGRRKPRLHDLRHSFAVHALVRCQAERDGVNRHMLALSTYLGHVSISSTYWYLEQTPELLRGIADACEPQLPEGLQ